jgi:hypothetical protein
MSRRHSTSSLASTDARDASKRQKLSLVPSNVENIPKFLSVAERETTKLVLENPPLDFSLKKLIRFSSPNSFDWCFSISSKDESVGLSGFVRGAAAGSTAHSTPVGQLFHSTILQYEHPSSSFTNSDPVLTTILAAQQGSLNPAEQACKLILAERWRQWEISFRSLYLRFRNQQVNHFYFDTAVVSILFLATSVHSDSLCAYIARAGRSFREILRKHDIGFTLEKHAAHPRPFDETASAHAVRAAALDEASALLIVQGRNPVHALIDVLLNNLKQHSDDVPVLRSTEAFVHASLKPLTVTGTKSQTVTGSNGESQELFCIDIAGTILPTTFIRLCLLFRASQGGNFTARFKNDDRSSSFHFIRAPLSAEQRKMYSDCCQMEVSKNGVQVSQLECNDGIFSVLIG